MRQGRYYIVRLMPLWLLLLTPFYLFPTSTRSLALLALPGLWWLQKQEKGYFIRRTLLDWPIFLMLVMVLVSLYATFDLTFSLSKVTGFLFHIAVFYAVVETVQTRVGLNRALVFYFLSGLVVIGLGLLGTQWMFKVPLLSHLTQFIPRLVQNLPGAETGIHPNQLAGTLLWFFPLQLSLIWGLSKHVAVPVIGSKRLTSLLLWGNLGVTGFTFLLTQSRGGWVGGVVALAFLGSILHRGVRWLVLIGLGIGFVSLGVFGWSTALDLFFSDATEKAIGSLGSLSFRMEIWRAALWGIADFPFTGMGMGTFRVVARLLYPLNVSPTYNISDAHNQFLQVALDLGLLGLIGFMALWFGAGYSIVYTIRHTRDAFIKVISLGIASCMIGYFVFAFSSIVALGAKPGVFFWWLLAMAVGIHQKTVRQVQ